MDGFDELNTTVETPVARSFVRAVALKTRSLFDGSKPGRNLIGELNEADATTNRSDGIHGLSLLVSDTNSSKSMTGDPSDEKLSEPINLFAKFLPRHDARSSAGTGLGRAEDVGHRGAPAQADLIDKIDELLCAADREIFAANEAPLVESVFLVGPHPGMYSPITSILHGTDERTFALVSFPFRLYCRCIRLARQTTLRGWRATTTG
jgi:hypothetical protein